MKKLFMEMHFSNPCLLSLLLINVDREILWKSQRTVMNGFKCLVSVSNNENPLKIIFEMCKSRLHNGNFTQKHRRISARVIVEYSAKEK